MFKIGEIQKISFYIELSEKFSDIKAIWKFDFENGRAKRRINILRKNVRDFFLSSSIIHLNPIYDGIKSLFPLLLSSLAENRMGNCSLLSVKRISKIIGNRVDWIREWNLMIN